jgi:hypothetical protein
VSVPCLYVRVLVRACVWVHASGTPVAYYTLVIGHLRFKCRYEEDGTTEKISKGTVKARMRHSAAAAANEEQVDEEEDSDDAVIVSKESSRTPSRKQAVLSETDDSDYNPSLSDASVEGARPKAGGARGSGSAGGSAGGSAAPPKAPRTSARVSARVRSKRPQRTPASSESDADEAECHAEVGEYRASSDETDADGGAGAAAACRQEDELQERRAPHLRCNERMNAAEGGGRIAETYDTEKSSLDVVTFEPLLPW